MRFPSCFFTSISHVHLLERSPLSHTQAPPRLPLDGLPAPPGSLDCSPCRALTDPRVTGLLGLVLTVGLLLSSMKPKGVGWGLVGSLWWIICHCPGSARGQQRMLTLWLLP